MRPKIVLMNKLIRAQHDRRGRNDKLDKEEGWNRERVHNVRLDQEQMIVLLQELKADYTTVSAILAGDAFNFREKDKFDITIKIKAVYDYTWEVYQKPADIKKNFADIHSELSKNFMEPSGKEANIFSTMAGMPEDAFQIYMNEIVEYYKAFFQNPKIYNTLALKEFFKISVGSFNQYNSGSKPFEGYVYKKAYPQCL